MGGMNMWLTSLRAMSSCGHQHGSVLQRHSRWRALISYHKDRHGKTLVPDCPVHSMPQTQPVHSLARLDRVPRDALSIDSQGIRHHTVSHVVASIITATQKTHLTRGIYNSNDNRCLYHSYQSALHPDKFS